MSDLALAVDRVTAWVVQSAYRDDERATWVGTQPPDVSTDPPRFATLGPDLYDGTAGVALYLAERGARGDETATHLAIQALRQTLHLRSEISARSSLGLYSGLPGILVATDSVMQLNDDARVEFESAFTGVLAEIDLQLDSDPEEFDLISGMSGAIVGLLAVDASGHALDLALTAATRLLAVASSTGDTLFWRDPKAPRNLGLTGLSHGASGPAVAFSELFAATQEERWRDASLAAFAYERRWFDAPARNWPDLRRRQRVRIAESLPFVTAWCHGAAGIGLARAHAFVRLDDEVLREEALVSMETTVGWLRENLDRPWAGPTLCHGIAGNAAIVLTVARLLDVPELAGLAMAAAEDLSSAALSQDLDEGDMATPALMLGWSGIAMFLQDCLRPLGTSPLLPGLELPDNQTREQRGGFS